MLIVCIGDLHFEYCSKEKLGKALDLIPSLNPTHIVQMGDLYDFVSLSRFPKSIKLSNSEAEVYNARIAAEEFWGILNKRCKKAIKYQLTGNHDDRPYKKMLEKCPELSPFCDFESLWKFDGVKTIFDSRDVLEINDIVFTHGHRSKIGDHMRYMHKSVVCGHLHRMGILFQNINGKTLFEMNVGYLADPFHESLIYRPTKKFFDWTHGFGLIDKFGPRIISL